MCRHPRHQLVNSPRSDFSGSRVSLLGDLIGLLHFREDTQFCQLLSICQVTLHGKRGHRHARIQHFPKVTSAHMFKCPSYKIRCHRIKHHKREVKHFPVKIVNAVLRSHPVSGQPAHSDMVKMWIHPAPFSAFAGRNDGAGIT